jgi:hypothetical protein
MLHPHRDATDDLAPIGCMEPGRKRKGELVVHRSHPGRALFTVFAVPSIAAAGFLPEETRGSIRTGGRAFAAAGPTTTVLR